MVDDDKYIRDLIASALSGKGYVTDSVESGSKALQKVNQTEYHVFLIDISMPEMDGIELLEKLDLPNHPSEAIMITGYGGLDTARKAMEMGAFSYLQKPFSSKTLEVAIRKAVEFLEGKLERLHSRERLENEVREKTRHLQKEIEEHRQARMKLQKSEQALLEANALLNEKNSALRELIRQIEEQKSATEKQIHENIRRLVLPGFANLRKRVSRDLVPYVDLIEANLGKTGDSILQNPALKAASLSQREVEICDMVSKGMVTKEIAAALNISARTVETHRSKIRKKLNLSRNVNLHTYSTSSI